jgi:hypothetical protein
MKRLPSSVRLAGDDPDEDDLDEDDVEDDDFDDDEESDEDEEDDEDEPETWQVGSPSVSLTSAAEPA